MKYSFEQCPICNGKFLDSYLLSSGKNLLTCSFCSFEYLSNANLEPYALNFNINNYQISTHYYSNNTIIRVKTYINTGNFKNTSTEKFDYININIAPVWNFSDLNKLYFKIKNYITFI